MTTVMCFGTFDLLHPGHRAALSEARRYGDRLIVVLARDATVRLVKGHDPLHTEQERRQNLLHSGLADEVVLGSHGDKYDVIRRRHPDVIALGYDQTTFAGNLPQKIGPHVKIVRLKSFHPERYKSSLLRMGYEKKKNSDRHHQ